MDWTDLAQDRDRGRAFVTAVMNIRIYKLRGFIDQLRNGQFLKKNSASWSKDNNNNNLSKNICKYIIF